MGGVLAVQEVDLYAMTAEAFAQARVFGYLECYGDSSAEMFDLMLLGIHYRLAEASQPVADSVFGVEKIGAIARAMDDDDYAESGLGVSLSVGGSVSSGDEGMGAAAGAGLQAGTRIQSDGRGGLREEETAQVEGALSGAVDPFAVGGKLLGKWRRGQFTTLEAELAGEAMIGADQLSELVVGGRWLSGVIGQLGGIVSGGSSLLGEPQAARRAGGLASFIHQSSGSGVLAEAASARAITQLRGMGVNLGHKLTLKGTWEEGKGYGVEILLERVSQIEYGDNPRDLVHVLVENVQRVFRIQVGP